MLDLYFAADQVLNTRVEVLQFAIVVVVAGAIALPCTFFLLFPPIGFLSILAFGHAQIAVVTESLWRLSKKPHQAMCTADPVVRKKYARTYWLAVIICPIAPLLSLAATYWVLELKWYR